MNYFILKYGSLMFIYTPKRFKDFKEFDDLCIDPNQKIAISSLKQEHCKPCCCCYSGFGRFQKEKGDQSQYYCFRCKFILQNFNKMENNLFAWQLQIMDIGKKRWPDCDPEYQYSRHIKERTDEILKNVE